VWRVPGQGRATRSSSPAVDGPDFDGIWSTFDDLMLRLQRYTKEEKAAQERWSESCRMSKQVDPGVLEAFRRVESREMS